jgi:heterodisulfide reductase subunit C
MILLGFKEEVIKSQAIWLCAGCHTCADRCPRGVAFIDVIRDLQNEATRRGYAPKQLQAVADAVIEQGWTLNFEDFEFLRLDMNLPSLPEADVGAIKKIAKLLKLTR